MKERKKPKRERERDSETKDAKCKILNHLDEINNRIKQTIGNNFKLE